MTGLALNLGHYLAAQLRGQSGAAREAVIEADGGAIAVWDPDNLTPSGGWSDWAQMWDAITTYQTTEAGDDVTDAYGRRVSILLYTRNAGAADSVIDVPAGVYELNGPIAFVAGGDPAQAANQDAPPPIEPATVLRFGVSGPVSFVWAGELPQQDAGGPRIETYGIRFHSQQDDPLFTVAPRPVDTRATLTIRMVRSVWSVGAGGPGVMIDVQTDGELLIHAVESTILRDDFLSTVPGVSVPVLTVGNGGFGILRLTASQIGDQAIGSNGTGFIDAQADPSSWIGYSQTTAPLLFGGTLPPPVRPVWVAEQCEAVPGPVPRRILPACRIQADPAVQPSAGDVIGWAIEGTPDLAWEFVAGAPAAANEVQIQGTALATWAELADRINANPAAPYTAVYVDDAGGTALPIVVLVMKAATLTGLERPAVGCYSTVAPAVDLVQSRFRANLSGGPGVTPAQRGGEYGVSSVVPVTATAPGDAIGDGLGPTWGGRDQIPEGTIARTVYPVAWGPGPAGPVFRDLRLDGNSDWQPVDGYAATPASWSGSSPTTVQEAITRMAAAIAGSAIGPIP